MTTTTPIPGAAADFLTLLKDDAYAVSFQSMGQYRTALIEAYRTFLAAHAAPAPSAAPANTPAIVRDALEAAFEQRDGWKSLLAPAVRALGAAPAQSDAPAPSEAMYTMDQMRDYAEAYARSRKATDWPVPSVTAEAVATIHVDGSFVHVEWCGVTPNKASIKVFSEPAPSVAAVTLNDWTFKDFQDGKLLAQQADGSGAVVTDNPSDGIAQCILARLIKDILAQRAAPVAAEAEIFEWLETGISAVDCWYRGDPSYERDAYWMRDRVIDLVREAKKIFGTQRAGTGGDARDAVRQYTYASTQTTKCAACGEHKHTPLRIDWMGGYVCLTCIDHELEFREDAASAGDDGDAALLDAAKALVGGAMKTITGIYEVSGSDLINLSDALRAMEAAKS